MSEPYEKLTRKEFEDLYEEVREMPQDEAMMHTLVLGPKGDVDFGRGWRLIKMVVENKRDEFLDLHDQARIYDIDSIGWMRKHCMVMAMLSFCLTGRLKNIDIDNLTKREDHYDADKGTD